MKSDSLETPDVRMRRSIGGQVDVYVFLVIVCAVIASGEGYFLCLEGFGVENGCDEVESSWCRVVDVETEAASWSEADEGSGE